MLLLHFLLGLISSFLGSLTPSMLNMTAAKISLNNGKKEALKYAVGVSIMVFFQAYLAIIFTKYLRKNPEFIQNLQKIAIVIFAILSFYFYKQYKKQNIQNKSIKKGIHNTFAIGLILSGLNMFSIPFYCGVTTALDVAGWFQFNQKYIISFVIGSAIGTFILLYLYLKFAKKIQSKSKGLSKNLNIILSILTGVLAFITLFKVL